MTDLRAAAREVADSSRIANEDRPPTPRTRRWRMVLAAALLAALAAIAGEHTWRGTDSPAAPLPAPPQVTVSAPMRETVASTTGFLGQFSAVDAVELRAQVGGTLTRGNGRKAASGPRDSSTALTQSGLLEGPLWGIKSGSRGQG